MEDDSLDLVSREKGRDIRFRGRSVSRISGSRVTFHPEAAMQRKLWLERHASRIDAERPGAIALAETWQAKQTIYRRVS